MEHRALHRLMAAAIVNRSFRSRLLEDPLEAVHTGYLDQSFSLTREEQELLASIRVEDLPTLSRHIHHWISGNGHRGRISQFGDDGEL